MKMIKDNDVKYVDFRFTDPRGKWQHVTFDVTHDRRGHVRRRPDVRRLVDRRLEGDQRVRHEPDAGSGDAPASIRSSPRPRWSLVCDVLEPTTGEPYNRDPRGIAKKAEGMVKSMGIGDTIFFGPEAEFFVFDDVQIHRQPLQHRLQAQLGRVPDQFRHRIRRRQSRPPHRHQEGLFPGAAAGLGAGHALGNARRHGAHGRPRSRSTTTRWPPPSTSSA